MNLWHHILRILGVGLSHYEGVALTVDNPTEIPAWSDLCWPNPDGRVHTPCPYSR